MSVGDGKSIAFVMQGRALALPLKLLRNELTTRAVTITVTKLSKGLTADPLVVSAGAVEATLTLRAATAPTSEQGPAALEIAAVEAGDLGAGATTKLSAFVRGTPGALDTTFGTTGALLHPYGTVTDTAAEDAKVLGDGSILIGLRRVNNTAVSRFTSAGILDTTFGENGTTNVNVSQGSIVLDVYEPTAPAKGFIYALDRGSNGGRPTLFHLNLDGSFDVGFNGTGQVTVDDGLPAAGGVYGSQVLALPDGKALVLANHPVTGATVVTRWNANGTRDDGYGSAATCQVSVTSRVSHMVFRTGGGVIVAGRVAGSEGVLQGCTATGARDTTIGTAPDYRYDLAAELVDFANGANGGLVLLTNNTAVPTPFSAWSRVNSAFVADLSIGVFGNVTTPLGPATTFAVQKDGGVVVGVADGSDFTVAAYASNGKPVADFGTAGIARFNVADTNAAELYKLVAQPDGRILALGKHFDTADAAILRFWP